MTMVRIARGLALIVCLANAAAAIAVDRIVFEDDTGRIVTSTLQVGARTYPVEWHLPSVDAVGLAQSQHGFSRQCRNLRDTHKAMMRKGMMVLCLDADMSGGNPKLANALANTLVAGVTAPGGQEVPGPIVVGGHSAGGMFASYLGAKLRELAPLRLAGAVLFDPVSADDAAYQANLSAISAQGRRPVLAVTANGSGCNAANNGEPALRQVSSDAIAAGRDGFVGVRLIDRSTHVDAEGNNTNSFGWLFCGQGEPRAFNTDHLRALTSQWAADAAQRSRTPAVYPGGEVLEGIIDAGDARLITDASAKPDAEPAGPALQSHESADRRLYERL